MTLREPTISDELKRQLSLITKRVLEDMTLLGDKVYADKTLTESEKVISDYPPVRSRLVLGEEEAKIGEEIRLEFEIVNDGRTPVFLSKIEEVIPTNFEILDYPDYCTLTGSSLDLNRRRLNPTETEEVQLVLQPFDRGRFSIMPKITFRNGREWQIFCDPCCITLDILENTFPNRVKTGFKELDTLLLGGIPNDFAVILTSPSCDEKHSLITRFLETGLKKGEVTFYFTIETTGVKTFAEDYQESFYIFLFNPQADAMIKSLHNVYKLKGVENLTDINIALTDVFRKLDASQRVKRRACINVISDILLQHKATQSRRWLTGLLPELRARGFTTLGVINPYMHPPEEVQAVLDLFEGEINIYEKEDDKYLKIRKLYNQAYIEAERSLKKNRLDTGYITRRGRYHRV